MGQHSWDPARTGGCVAAQKAFQAREEPARGASEAQEVCPPGSKERRGRAGGGRRAGGRRAPSLRRLARPSERNGTMVSGRGEDHKKRRGSSRRTKTQEIRRASVGGQPRVDGGNQTGTARTKRPSQIKSVRSSEPWPGSWAAGKSDVGVESLTIAVPLPKPGSRSSACWQGLRPPPESQQGLSVSLSDVRYPDRAQEPARRISHALRGTRTGRTRTGGEDGDDSCLMVWWRALS